MRNAYRVECEPAGIRKAWWLRLSSFDVLLRMSPQLVGCDGGSLMLAERKRVWLVVPTSMCEDDGPGCHHQRFDR